MSSGTLSLTQAFLPLMRAKKSGVIINVSSSVTTKAMPLIGLYRASKAALNAWSESLAIEVRPFGIRVHVVLPGRSPETKFGENAQAYFGGRDDPAYGKMVNEFIQMVGNSHAPVTHADDVADAILPSLTINTPRCTPLLVKMRWIFLQKRSNTPPSHTDCSGRRCD